MMSLFYFITLFSSFCGLFAFLTSFLEVYQNGLTKVVFDRLILGSSAFVLSGALLLVVFQKGVGLHISIPMVVITACFIYFKAKLTHE